VISNQRLEISKFRTMQSKALLSGRVAQTAPNQERKNLVWQSAAASRDGKKLKSTFEAEFIGNSSSAVGMEEISWLFPEFNLRQNEVSKLTLISLRNNGSRVSQETIYGDLSFSNSGRRAQSAHRENLLAALHSCWRRDNSRIGSPTSDLNFSKKDSYSTHLLRAIGIQSNLSGSKGFAENFSSYLAAFPSTSSKHGHLTSGTSMNSHQNQQQEAIAWRKHVLDRG